MWFYSIVLGTETGVIRFQKNPKNVQSWLVSVISTPIMVTCYTSHTLLLVLLPLLNTFQLPSMLLKLLMTYLLLSTFLTHWMIWKKFIFCYLWQTGSIQRTIQCDRRTAQEDTRQRQRHIPQTSGRSLLCVNHFRFAVHQREAVVSKIYVS